MAAQDLPAFDPALIERHVENTYRKATAIFLGSVVAGVVFGAVVGAMPLTSLGESWPIPRMFGFATMLLGAIVGGVIGYIVGDTRAFLARLQGQTALAQVEAAKDARAALETLRQIHALATRRVPTPQAQPQLHRQPQPAPPQPHRQPEPARPQPTAAPTHSPPVVAPAPARVEPPAAPPTLVVAGGVEHVASPPLNPPVSS
jgi:hypothetical protein